MIVNLSRIVLTFWVLAWCIPVYAIDVGGSFDVIVSKRDTLASIFKRYGLHQKELYQMLDQVKQDTVTNIRPGQLIHFDTGAGRSLYGMKIFRSSDEIIEVKKNKGRFRLEKVQKLQESLFRRVSFTLKKSLYVDGRKHRLSPASLVEIDNIMKSDPEIDPKKLSAGTKVSIILESGTENKSAKVVSITVDKKKYSWSVTRFSDNYSTNFYHTDGTTAAVSFLKYPLQNFRISSPFSPSRMHPIHHYRRPHYGVDMAAPSGTSIWATASGRVTFMGVKGGYGKTIIIEHGSQYQTIYAHLSGFKRNLKVGDMVSQKQIIGYVGSTGHATGPHLHYEMRLRGIPIDPMRTKLPKKSRLKGELLAAFKSYQGHIEKVVSAARKNIGAKDDLSGG